MQKGTPFLSVGEDVYGHLPYYTGGGILLKQSGRSKSRFSNKKQNYSNTSALTCTVCGYTSIYADQPGNLIPDD